MKRKIYVVEMPLVSKEYAEALNRKFPEIKPAPGVDRDDLLFNAGQRKVIEFVLNSTMYKEVTGDESKIRDTNKPSTLAKLVDGLRRSIWTDK